MHDDKTAHDWTTDVVLDHAQIAIDIELYTLPLYLTALASIDTNYGDYPMSVGEEIRNLILGVAMEEMLHLQIASNLCVALGGTPLYRPPAYGEPVPYLNPADPATQGSHSHHVLLNATPGPLDAEMLKDMLDIETPDALEPETSPNNTPSWPYDSIGEMYNALMWGIQNGIDGDGTTGPDRFTWPTDHQQAIFGDQPFPQVIKNVAGANQAVDVICVQGEGTASHPVPSLPYKEADFVIPTSRQVTHGRLDSTQQQYAHFGRFLRIQELVAAHGFPPTIQGAPASDGELAAAQARLQHDFATVLQGLADVWSGKAQTKFWQMTHLLNDATAVFRAGGVPVWSSGAR